SKIPQPWMQAYSVPERLTPCSRTTCPALLTSWLPCTCRPAGAGVGEGEGVGVGDGDGDGTGLGEGEGLGDGDGLGEGEGRGVGDAELTLRLPALSFQLSCELQPGAKIPILIV